MRGMMRLAALSGAIAVVAGAYGAHGAQGEAATWMRIGAEYQMIHAVAALVVASRANGRPAAALFLGGAALFAGSLYAMALGGPSWLGAVTPVGGLGLIGGWLVTAIRA